MTEWIELASEVFSTLKIATVDILGYFIKAQKVSALLDTIGIIIGLITIPLVYKSIMNERLKQKISDDMLSDDAFWTKIGIGLLVGLVVTIVLMIICKNINCFINPEYCAINNLIFKMRNV